MKELDLYLVIPDWHGEREEAHESVVEVYHYGRGDLRVATELWRIAGHEARGRAIAALLDAVFERSEVHILRTDEIRQLLALLDGLEPALELVTGPRLIVPPERLPALRAKVAHMDRRLIDLDETRGDDARYGFAEAIGRVGRLETMLARALEKHLYIDFG